MNGHTVNIALDTRGDDTVISPLQSSRSCRPVAVDRSTRHGRNVIRRSRWRRIPRNRYWIVFFEATRRTSFFGARAVKISRGSVFRLCDRLWFATPRIFLRSISAAKRGNASPCLASRCRPDRRLRFIAFRRKLRAPRAIKPVFACRHPH